MSVIKGIRRIVSGSKQEDGAGVRLRRVLGPETILDFDPFLMLDAFDSRDPSDYVKGFPWHPHRGIETVTYLISGEIEHGDSLGNKGRILDGCCQWMTAGSGIIHQEMPQASPLMLGFQLWINLPKKDKWARPQYREIEAAKIPKVDGTSGSVRVISGSYAQVDGATQGDYVKTLMLDVELTPGSFWSLAVDPQDTLFIYVIDGDGSLPGGSSRLEKRRTILFGEGGEFAVEAGTQGMRFALFAGRPLREPVAWGGPIVMNTQEELDQAFRELDAGTFIRANGGLPSCR